MIATVRRALGPRLGPLAAILLALIQGGLLTSVAWDKSDTADEPSYIVGGVRQWVRGDYLGNCHAPPFPRWGFASFLRVADPELYDEWRSGAGPHPIWSHEIPEMRRNLLAARLATVLVTVSGGLLLWLAARRFGTLAGFVTHLLWCFSPTVLANGSLATLDAWAASLLCAGIWASVRLWERPTAWRWLQLGVLAGLAAGSKVTTVALLPVSVCVGIVALRRALPAAVWRRGLVSVALAALGFVATLWVLYGFDSGVVNTAALCETDRGVGDMTFGPVPAPLWIEGALLQWRRGQVGWHNYLFGEVSRTGWWWFYIAAFMLKTTIAAQLLAALAVLVRLKARPVGGWMVDLAILSYPTLMLVVMSLGETQSGIRYALPAFPFAMLWLGRQARDVVEGLPKGRFLLAGLLALSLVETLSVHPHHLMFFNRWIGGPENGPRYLVHGDDWGQDQLRLSEWQHTNRIGRLFYTRYVGRPEAWGIVSRQPPCKPKLIGKYALHAVEVHRPKRVKPGCLDWLTAEPPDERIGYSIYIYRVDAARLERLKRQPPEAPVFWRSGPGPIAGRPRDRPDP